MLVDSNSILNLSGGTGPAPPLCCYFESKYGLFGRKTLAGELANPTFGTPERTRATQSKRKHRKPKKQLHRDEHVTHFFGYFLQHRRFNFKVKTCQNFCRKFCNFASGSVYVLLVRIFSNPNGVHTSPPGCIRGV